MHLLAGVLPSDLVGLKPTLFALAVINTSSVMDTADAETLAQVLQEQLLKVCTCLQFSRMISSNYWSVCVFCAGVVKTGMSTDLSLHGLSFVGSIGPIPDTFYLSVPTGFHNESSLTTICQFP